MEDTEKIFFAISYLWGIALDYIEPFIAENDELQTYDFLEEWPAFVQKLSNLFGFYSPEDDDEDALVAISFPNNGKAVNYFIQFAKYQNRIRWDDRSLQKVVKDALPTRICDELRFCHEDISSFEGLKRAVLRVDNNYWKQNMEESNRNHTSLAPPRPSQTDQNSSLPLIHHTNLPNRLTWEKPRPTPFQVPTPRTDPSNSFPTAKLGPDGHLTPAECQRRMSLGLCMHCGQSGHLARNCPKQNPRPANTVEGRAIYLEQETEDPELAKKANAVNFLPGESAA